MPYVIVVLDVGAAMKPLRTVWNYPKEYKKHKPPKRLMIKISTVYYFLSIFLYFFKLDYW